MAGPGFWRWGGLEFCRWRFGRRDPDFGDGWRELGLVAGFYAGWFLGVWRFFLGGFSPLPENTQGHSEYHAACGGVVSFFSFPFSFLPPSLFLFGSGFFLLLFSFFGFFPFSVGFFRFFLFHFPVRFLCLFLSLFLSIVLCSCLIFFLFLWVSVVAGRRVSRCGGTLLRSSCSQGTGRTSPVVRPSGPCGISDRVVRCGGTVHSCIPGRFVLFPAA